MDMFFGLGFCAIVVEGVISYVKMIIVDHKVNWQTIIAILLGVGVGVAFGLDLFALVGIEARIPHVGSALTGILISRGSNYMYDLLKNVRAHTAEAESH